MGYHSSIGIRQVGRKRGIALALSLSKLILSFYAFTETSRKIRMFVFVCTVLTFVGGLIGIYLAGDIGFFLGAGGGAVLGWYYLGNWLNVDDH